MIYLKLRENIRPLTKNEKNKIKGEKMAEVKSLDDLTWESKSYEDGEKREFCNAWGWTGIGKFKGDVLELNFNSVKIPNFGKKVATVTHKMLKVPKEVGVVIKIDGETEYLKEKNVEVISQIIVCRDIDGFFIYLRYSDFFCHDICLKSSDGKFLANYKNNKLQEISIADKFRLSVDDVVTQKKENSQRAYEVKKQYKIEASDFMIACEVYGHLRYYQVLEKINSEDLEILKKMIKDEIKEKLPEIIFEDGNFKEFANLKDRTPENLFAVQKLYKYVPNLNFEETVNMLETLDDATFEFWLCGLGNKIKVQYSKGAVELHVKNKINFEKMFELFEKLKPLRKYGKFSILTEEKGLYSEELRDEIVFHKGRMALKDLKLLTKHGITDKKVIVQINDRDRFIIDVDGKIGISESSLEKYNLKDFETYIL